MRTENIAATESEPAAISEPKVCHPQERAMWGDQEQIVETTAIIGELVPDHRVNWGKKDDAYYASIYSGELLLAEAWHIESQLMALLTALRLTVPHILSHHQGDS